MARRVKKSETRLGQMLAVAKAFESFRPASEILTRVRAVPHLRVRALARPDPAAVGYALLARLGPPPAAVGR